MTRVQPSLMEQIQYESEVLHDRCHPTGRIASGESGIEVMENIVKMDRFGKCVAIGECGLDRLKNNKVSIRSRGSVPGTVELAMRLDLLPWSCTSGDAQKKEATLDIL